VWVANIYMSAFNRLRLEIKHENLEIKHTDLTVAEKAQATRKSR
jgi:hypothetical protein